MIYKIANKIELYISRYIWTKIKHKQNLVSISSKVKITIFVIRLLIFFLHCLKSQYFFLSFSLSVHFLLYLAKHRLLLTIFILFPLHLYSLILLNLIYLIIYFIFILLLQWLWESTISQSSRSVYFLFRIFNLFIIILTVFIWLK